MVSHTKKSALVIEIPSVVEMAVEDVLLVAVMVAVTEEGAAASVVEVAVVDGTPSTKETHSRKTPHQVEEDLSVGDQRAEASAAVAAVGDQKEAAMVVAGVVEEEDSANGFRFTTISSFERCVSSVAKTHAPTASKRHLRAGVKSAVRGLHGSARP